MSSRNYGCKAEIETHKVHKKESKKLKQSCLIAWAALSGHGCEEQTVAAAKGFTPPTACVVNNNVPRHSTEMGSHAMLTAIP